MFTSKGRTITEIKENMEENDEGSNLNMESSSGKDGWNFNFLMGLNLYHF